MPENHRFVSPIRSKPFNLFNMENVITQVGEPTNYASFGRRLVALIIDGIIIGVAQSFIIVPIMISLGLGVASKIETDSLETMEPGEAMGIFSAMMGAGLMIQLVSWGISGVYFVLMESSEKQATLGKIAMGLKVTDLNGNRITPTTAIIRFVGRIVSGMIMLIGYIMAAFTAKKQALHDMIASTLVLKS